MCTFRRDRPESHRRTRTSNTTPSVPRTVNLPPALDTPLRADHQPASYSRSAFKSQCDKWLQKLDFVIKFT